MALPVANSNFNATAFTNGTFCTLTAPQPAIAQQNQAGTGMFTCQVIDLATYFIVVGSGTSAGTVTFQAQQANGTWNNLAAPVPLSLVFATAPTYNGVINGPFHGLRMVFTAVAGGTITYAELIGSIRSL